MTDNSRINTERDTVLLRLELYLDGETVEEGNVSVRRLEDGEPDAGAELNEDELTELACRIYESRRQRTRFLSTSLLGEPVWDMLLALYCFSSRGKRMSVSSLCYASGVPSTTALRWVSVMEERDLIERSKDQHDARRTYLRLTGQGKRVMERYLRSIHQPLIGDGEAEPRGGPGKLIGRLAP
jgi:DNA-binding MarR family transcriptional regulator